MKLFIYRVCKSLLNFENTHCLGCNHVVGFLPEIGELASFNEAGDDLLQANLPEWEAHRYRKCLRYSQDGICNWMVHVDDGQELCRSCRMTSVIPDLAVLSHWEAWHKMELAKRRWWYGLHYLGLPIDDRHGDPEVGMTFAFMADTSEIAVTTGHNDGVITVNLSEADPVERERARSNLSEPYRTLLGHMRHESGHYYWDRLVKKSEWLNKVRAMFGDERLDYKTALTDYYAKSPNSEWTGNYVSDYATMHPWEDWAETWAHYLHVVDSVEMASYLGLSLNVFPSGSTQASISVIITRQKPIDFEKLLAAWFPLSYANNCLNRSIGHNDWYPFTLGPGAIEKLRLVHTIVHEASRQVG